MPVNDTNKLFSDLIRARRTVKVLASKGHEVLHSPEVLRRCNELVLNSIADAGFAPFHYDRGEDGIAEPWRFHVLWQDECRTIARKLYDWFPDIRPSNKLPPMLLACGCLVLVNWIPQFPHDRQDAEETCEKQIQIDEEHLAATAAAVQILLLSLTAQEFNTYWSSGGFFRTPEMSLRLGIPPNERLLAAVFVDFGTRDDVEIIYGKQADARSEFRKWTREISL